MSLSPAEIRTKELKDMLRGCKTVAEVNETVNKIASEVAKHPDIVGVIHIKNLAQYRRICIENGWPKEAG